MLERFNEMSGKNKIGATFIVGGLFQLMMAGLFYLTSVNILPELSVIPIFLVTVVGYFGFAVFILKLIKEVRD